ncbi:MAG: alanine racemase, partial [Bryobacteraceae bacterium]
MEVSRRRIAENFRAVRGLVGSGVEVMPVVKADAYGHGAVEVSRVLEAERARWLAVSSVAEGVMLREAGLQAGILVMTGFLPDEAETLAPLRLTPVLHDTEAIAALDRLAE